MAIFEHTRKNGLQLGTVGDECLECVKNHARDEDWEAPSLDYQPVFKLWVNNMSRCFCMDCFQKMLGDYVLINPNEIVQEEVKEEVEEVKVEEKKSNKKNAKKEDK